MEAWSPTCVGATFAPRDEEAKGSVGWPGDLQQQGAVLEGLGQNGAQRLPHGAQAHPRGQNLFHTQGPLELPGGEVGGGQGEVGGVCVQSVWRYGYVCVEG